MALSAKPVIVQHLDDLAGGHPPASAFGRHPRQLCAQRLKLGDLRCNVGEVPLCDHVGFAAGTIRMIGQVEQGSDRIQVEAELTRMTNEGEAPQGDVVIEATVARRSRRRGQQPDLLVEADSRDLHAGGRGQLADGAQRRGGGGCRHDGRISA